MLDTRYVRTGHLNIFFTKTSDSTGLGIAPILVNGNDDKLLSIYPNPATGSIFFKFLKEQPGQIEVKIFNSNGGKLLSKGIKNTSKPVAFDISALSKGLYFLEATNEGIILYSDKIIVK
jgi:hypothetical protein